jgi:arylsulfatase A-like enzyme
VRAEPEYLTDFWTRHGVQFITENRNRPFFLLLAYNGPYGLGRSLLRPPRNRHAAFYETSDMTSFPREAMHPWLVNNREYFNNVLAMRRFAAEVSGVDDGVGAIIEALRRHDLERNTLVILAADQGWSGGQHGLWGMGDHTRPLHAFDGTMHIPLIFCQPDHIQAARTCDLMVSNYDFLPTLLDYLGMSDKIPVRPRTPGRSYAAALKGSPLDWENTVYYDFENVRAIRTEKWKYVERFPDGPHELYDLEFDAGEQFNLYGQPRQADIQEQLRSRMGAFFAKYADPQYDLWRGGHSKTRLLSGGGKTRLVELDATPQ